MGAILTALALTTIAYIGSKIGKSKRKKKRKYI